MAFLLLADLRGGASDQNPASLAENQVEAAWDVQYQDATLCARRRGSRVVASGYTNAINGLFHHTPNSFATSDELWTFDSLTFGAPHIVRLNTAYGVIGTVTPSPADIFAFNNCAAVSLHGKLFFAGLAQTASGVALARMHVWDGTTFRRAGLAAPTAAPLASGTGSGTYSSTRFMRTRAIAISGSTILRRSEPSAVTTFVPSGTGSGAAITVQGLPGEGETHWEFEESIDNANFYRIATVAIGDSLTDATAATAVATSGVLSATSGDYTLPPPAVYLTVDRDRLVMAGDYQDTTKASDVVWTPVGSDSAGVGNDERVPTSTGNRLVCDGASGGALTALVSFDTRIIAFKDQRIYSLVHTGVLTNAYQMNLVSSSYGAIPRTVIEGVDETGAPALYFLDARAGPCRLGPRGLEILAPFLQTTFLALMNTTFFTTAVYHPGLREVWWHFATLSRTTSQRWKYNTITKGITFDTLPPGCSGAALWNSKPHIVNSLAFSAPGLPFTNFGVIACDDTTSATSDYGLSFRSYIRTRAYELGNLLKRVEIKGAVVEGSVASSGTLFSLNLIRDYGLETRTAQFRLTQQLSENYAIRALDDAFLNEVSSVQFEIGDPTATTVQPWRLHRLVLLWKEAGSNV